MRAVGWVFLGMGFSDLMTWLGGHVSWVTWTLEIVSACMILIVCITIMKERT